MHFSKFIFDFDGTLVDSMPTWTEKMLRILKKEGIDYPDDIVKTITPLGDFGTARYFKEVLGARSNIEDMLAEMDDFALPRYENDITLKPGVMEYLTKLKKEGCSLSVLTASPRKMLIPCLENNGIYDLFDNIWSSDDFGKSKADPSIYLEVAAIIGSNPREIAFFDDNLNAISAASHAGFYTIGVYDDSGSFFEDEMIHSSNRYVYSFTELVNANI